MAIHSSASARGFFDDAIHPVLPEDAIEITAEYHAALMAGQAVGQEIVWGADGIPSLVDPVPPTEAEMLAAQRAVARIDRGPLCKALRAAGVLSDASAVVAAKGDWPAEFEGVLEAMAPTTRIDAQIDWADASVVRYQNPLLQSVALAWCDDDAAAATALLDSLFGLTWP